MAATRERIIHAASEVLTEEPNALPSVRTVASRAGVGASTLRYYFPTQRELLDAVLQQTFAQRFPDGGIRDVAVPAAVRLRNCLEGLLAPVGRGEQAREVMRGIMRTFLDPAHGQDAAAAMARINEAAGARVVSWLEVLEEQGELPHGDNRRRANVLLTVIDGLSLGRSLHGGELTPEQESAVLDDIVGAVLGGQPQAQAGSSASAHVCPDGGRS
ncbi:TetR family transcriptional regulator [Allosaccharopolyspora coralli]|uniref:TetR family transcriptional regulator n=1 Tax=Allosaccharopolyspora coralli TaxID=2665642 RepID=A0A5Q3Q5K4_9PSEU|nr:TetR/AcrR family transcriptional regulator [Allosaccharopolyspora coralli]QGK69100.1 TetR family transcriptional regulator [Allosaccharopolyspora coralli]